jgi:hypothetical protein
MAQRLAASWRFAKGMHNDWLSWRFAKGMHNDWLSWRFAKGHCKDPTTQRSVVGQIPARIFPREYIFANPIKRRSGVVALCRWRVSGLGGFYIFFWLIKLNFFYFIDFFIL